MAEIKFTRIISDQGPLTKRIFLGNDGSLTKKAAAQLYQGRYQVESVSGLEDFASMLSSADSETAFTYGIPEQSSGLIVRDDDLANHPGAIARTRDYFGWPVGPGILMIDDDSGLMIDNFAEFLQGQVPILDDIQMITRPSSSSWIGNRNTDGWLRTEINRRAYLLVSEAREIPVVGKLIEDHLWLAGHGYYDISKSGRLLKRCPADTSVWQPERLDFVGGAVCTPPLFQGELRPVISDGYTMMVDASKLPKLSERQQNKIRELEQVAKAQVDDERQQVMEAYLATRTDELIKKGVSPDTARSTVMSAVNGQTLSGEFLLTLQDGTSVSVAEMLAEPDKYHGKRCHDPLEPGYHNDPRVAFINLQGGSRPYIFSHAHGGCRYTLKKPAKTIQILTGESARGTDEIAQHLVDEGILYERGDLLVSLQEDGKTREVKPAALKYLAGSHCNLVRFDRRSNGLRQADLPDSIAQLVVTRTGHGVFPSLTAVITAPTMTPKGKIIGSTGYDKPTGLLLISNSELGFPTIDRRPTPQGLHKVFDQLWHPFKDFPFVDNASRSAMVAALLTAVVRPCLATSPGFGFDAPTAASGKTKLAQCVAALATGENEALLPPPSDDDETRKKIATALAATQQVMLFDNVEAQLKSPVLAAFLTAPIWTDRILGGNTEIRAQNRMLMLLTGNNLVPVGDIVRRLLMVRIDPQMEASEVWQREFDLEPLDYVIRHRQRLVAAVLTLLSGFVAAGIPKLGKGNLASFEEWDGLVRQCVIWLGQQGVGGLVDPVIRLNEAVANDPETIRLANLATNWFAQFQSAPQTLKDVVGVIKLEEVLKEVALDRRGAINTRVLAAYLGKRVGKIVSGYKFTQDGGRSNTSRWRVERVVGDADG